MVRVYILYTHHKWISFQQRDDHFANNETFDGDAPKRLEKTQTRRARRCNQDTDEDRFDRGNVVQESGWRPTIRCSPAAGPSDRNNTRIFLGSFDSLNIKHGTNKRNLHTSGLSDQIYFWPFLAHKKKKHTHTHMSFPPKICFLPKQPKHQMKSPPKLSKIFPPFREAPDSSV